jgi:hypothetical protein
MTGHELIAALKKLSHDELNQDVVFYNEYFLDDFDAVEMIHANNDSGYLDKSDDDLGQRYIYLERTF